MKILFIARHYSYLRLFESAIAALAERGHDIVLAADRDETMGGRGLVERLAARYPNVRLTSTPGPRVGAWAEIGRRLRLGIDYLRFLAPTYEATPHLRARVQERAPGLIVRLAESPLAALLGGVSGLGALLRRLERGIPAPPALEAFLRTEAPDVLMITPLVDVGSPQVEHFAIARRLGLRTILPVGSWDHLSSKSLLRASPDRVLVWNESQRTEAVDFHGVPRDRVVVTGAQCYDQWFGRQPARSRAEFCARVGLPPDRPFVLYVCSSLFRGTAHEPRFVEQWIQAIRGSADPRIRDLGILIRPHPQRLEEWKDVDISGYRDLAFWGAHPVDDEAKDDYFDSMYYSAAVVGINTSAFIEAAVVGKPVHTVIVPEISRSNQEGTLHFHYLMNVNGGLLRASRSLDEHVAALAASLAGEGPGDPRAAQFVEGFVRPFGGDVPATPRFVEAVEAVGRLPRPAPESGGTGRLASWLLLYPIAALMALNLRTQPLRKRARQRTRKAVERTRAAMLRRIKQFASDRMMKTKRPGETPAAGSSMLTPKARHQRDPAKMLTGSNLPVARETRELVSAIGRSGKPVILGPWLSETGFELIYWIPFLAWAKEHGRLDPDRLVAVSRGGAETWYRHVTPHYADIFSFYTPDEFRIANEARIQAQGGRLKHVGLSSFDREIIARVEAARGIKGAEVLHPSQMYTLFDDFWLQRTPVTLVEAFTQFAPMAAATERPSVLAQLPERYVAAKFYGNAALPDTPANRAFITSYLTELAQNVDVVLLNTPDQFDDHSDFPAVVRGRIHTIERFMVPERNLAVQTEVIRHAQAFVGTYGGFSYLAPLCGVNTLAFYSHASGFRFDHLEVAKRVFAGLQCGTFTEVDVRAAEALRLGFGGALDLPVGSR
jgi:hypothetical protein